jgi:hypothetical protein
MLGQVNEKKSLIYFASGLRLNGIDNQAQLHATVDAAIKAGVFLLDPSTRAAWWRRRRWATRRRARRATPAMYTGASALANTSNFQQSQDTLYALAGDTGGKAFLDNNDLDRGIVQAQEAISDYYISATTPPTPSPTATSAASRSRSRKIWKPSSTYRQGYYADKEFSKFTASTRSASLKTR